jgi:hypothetical protein
LNGGSEFSERHCEVLKHDKPTGITHFVRTNGSPDYKKIVNEFHHGEDTFDVLKGGSGDELLAWLDERTDP